MGEAAPAQRRKASTAAAACVIALVIVAGVLLLGLSLVPSSTLAGRLLGAAGESRAGPYTQDLYAHLAERLRLASLVLLGGALLLVPLRVSLQTLLACSVADLPAWRVSISRAWLPVGGLMLLGLGLRIAFLNQPIRYDEALTYNEFASRPLYYGLSFYPEPNNHLLNTLLVHALLGLGSQPWVLRIPALLAGVLLVPATYSLGHRLHGHGTGLLAAALVAASSYLTEYSTNSRGYTLQALAFVVAFDLVVRGVRDTRRAWLVAAAAVVALGFWAVPTMAYGLAVIAAWLAVEARAGRIRLGWSELAALLVGLGLVTFVLYAPVVLVSGPERLLANRFVEPLGPLELVRDLATSLRNTWQLWNRDLPWPLAGPLLVGLVWQVVEACRRRQVPLAGLSVGVCLVLVLLQRVAPFERVWLFLLPIYFIEASAGLLDLVGHWQPSVPARVGGLATVGLACVLGSFVLSSGSILASTETGAFPDAQAVTRALRPRLQAEDAVLTLLPASLPELQYYFRRVGLPPETLVRSPDTAQRAYVIAATEDVHLDGFGAPELEQRFPSSTLYRVER